MMPPADTHARVCGDWPSPLTPEALFQARQVAANPLPFQGGLLFLLTMPEEGNAQALMYVRAGQLPVRVSPPGFNLRSRLHEYGGMPFTAGSDTVYYCNFQDQAIYRQSFQAEPVSVGQPQCLLASHNNDLRYAELLLDSERQRLLCVREDHRGSAGQADRVRNTLVALALDRDEAARDPDQVQVLFKDSDFVASPCLSPDGQQLAFITWSHPNMPFDDTELRLAELDGAGLISDCRKVDAAVACSRQQPAFSAGGVLYLLSDEEDFWNLRRVSTLQAGMELRSEPVYTVAADCCPPPWQTGNHNYALVDESTAVITVVQDCRWALHRIHLDQGAGEVMLDGLGQVEQLRVSGPDQISFLGADDCHYASLHCLRLTAQDARPELLYQSPQPRQLSADWIARPAHFSFATASAEQAHGLMLPPTNPEVAMPDGELPPLLVNVHGGPTGTARAVLNPLHQFWTSRGFAVLDLNHRGSTGYGREFRQRLYGEWGVVDIEDIVAAVKHLVETGKVDASRIAIRGGSAGGYAVLASLAACDLFAAGVSYYGVSDLELLARDTHKFESRYLDQLIGPWPEAAPLYRQRSPIHNLASIHAPVLLLQGEDDRVVPLNQAETIYAQLREDNPATELLRFAGEGHGFRKAENQIRALRAELDFYRRNLLKLEAGDNAE